MPSPLVHKIIFGLCGFLLILGVVFFAIGGIAVSDLDPTIGVGDFKQATTDQNQMYWRGKINAIPHIFDCKKVYTNLYTQQGSFNYIADSFAQSSRKLRCDEDKRPLVAAPIITFIFFACALIAVFVIFYLNHQDQLLSAVGLLGVGITLLFFTLFSVSGGPTAMILRNFVDCTNQGTTQKTALNTAGMYCFNDDAQFKAANSCLSLFYSGFVFCLVISLVVLFYIAAKPLNPTGAQRVE